MRAEQMSSYRPPFDMPPPDPCTAPRLSGQRTKLRQQGQQRTTRVLREVQPQRRRTRQGKGRRVTGAETGSLTGRWVLAVDSRQDAEVAAVLRDVHNSDDQFMALLFGSRMAAELAAEVHGEGWREVMAGAVAVLDMESAIDGVDVEADTDRRPRRRARRRVSENGQRPRARGSGRRWRTLKANVRARREDCCRCWQPIDYNLDYPHPNAFSVDHYPHAFSTHPHLSEDPANLRAAHLRCNQSAGNHGVAAGLGSLSEQW